MTLSDPAVYATLQRDFVLGWTNIRREEFVGDLIGEFINKTGIKDKLQKRNIVIPGYAAVILGDLEEEVGGDWSVHVGPREASNIPAYLKENYS